MGQPQTLDQRLKGLGDVQRVLNMVGPCSYDLQVTVGAFLLLFLCFMVVWLLWVVAVVTMMLVMGLCTNSIMSNG